MLEEILVENLLIIDSLHVNLHEGLNVISGETGVGKSLLLSSVGLLLGAKVEIEVKAGKELRVEGRFRLNEQDLKSLEAVLDQDLDDGELVIRIVKKAGGQQRCYVNGAMTSRRELAEIGGRLVDVHGQRDMQKLLQRREQSAVLDLFAGTTELCKDFARTLDSWRGAQRKLTDRIEAERKLVDRLDLLRFQRDELEAAEIRPGEKEELEAQAKKAQVARSAAETASRAVDALEEEKDGVVDRLNLIGKELDRLGDRDPELATLAERAFELAQVAADLGRDLQDLGQDRSQLEDDPSLIEERLDLLNTLERKYRRDADGLLEHLRTAITEIEQLETELAGFSGLDGKIVALEASLLKLGRELQEKRVKAGKKLAKAVEAELHELKMPHARFQVDPGAAPEVFDARLANSQGFGEPGFELRSNPGSPFSALEDAASGGELSRVLLALKSVLADSHNLPLMIFDEIETGVGPRLGVLLGRKLRALSQHRQVLCITHFPQIAAYANRHLKIDKVVSGGRTRATVEEVRDEGRLAELGAMLGGGDEKLAREQARRLLEEAGETKSLAEEGA